MSHEIGIQMVPSHADCSNLASFTYIVVLFRVFARLLFSVTATLWSDLLAGGLGYVVLAHAFPHIANIARYYDF